MLREQEKLSLTIGTTIIENSLVSRITKKGWSLQEVALMLTVLKCS